MKILLVLLTFVSISVPVGASATSLWEPFSADDLDYLSTFMVNHGILPARPDQEAELSAAQKQAFEDEINKQVQLAQADNAEAMLRAGLLYEHRHRYTKSGEDRVQTVWWYGKAANLDNPVALTRLGLCLLGNYGATTQNAPRAALKMYRRAAQLNFVPAMYCYIATLDYKGLNPTAEDETDGFQIVRRMVELIPMSKDPGAHINYANWLQQGRGCNITSSGLKTAFDIYDAAAKMNYEGAYGLLGICYDRGLGVRENPQMANVWYLRGVQVKDPDCCFALARNLYHHRGVSQSIENHARALKILKTGAETGDSLCQAAAGICLYTGVGCEINEENFKSAFDMLALAWGQGHAQAGDHLAFLLQRGLGCDLCAENLKGGTDIYRELAQAGYELAYFPYAHCLHFAVGMSFRPENQQDMILYLMKAATSGSISAMERLMYCNLFGVGMPANRKEVIQWYEQIEKVNVRAELPNLDVAHICMGWYYALQEASDGTVKALEHFNKVQLFSPLLTEMGMLYLRAKKYTTALACLAQAGRKGKPASPPLVDFLGRKIYAEMLGKKKGTNIAQLCRAQIDAVLHRHHWMAKNAVARVKEGAFMTPHYNRLLNDLHGALASYAHRGHAAQDLSTKVAETIVFDAVLDKYEHRLYFLELFKRHLAIKEILDIRFQMQWDYSVPENEIFD